MSIELDYTNLPKSTVVPTFLKDGACTQKLDLTAPDTFVTGVMIPIMKALASQVNAHGAKPYVYSYFKGSACLKAGDPAKKLSFAYLRKSRAYDSAFHLFSTYGINLSGLWLAFEQETNTLYVQNRIFQFANKLDADTQAQYVMNLMYYLRFLFALTVTESDLVGCVDTGRPTFSISSKALQGILDRTDPRVEKESVNLALLPDDCVFTGITYVKADGTSDLPLALNQTAAADRMVYNVIEAGGKNYLAIVNKTFKEPAFYVVDFSRRVLFTNMELHTFNCMLDGSEFIPSLIRACIGTYQAKSMSFSAVYVKSDMLLDSAIASPGEFEVSSAADAQIQLILDAFPTLAENFDAKVYEHAHTKALSAKKASIGSSLADQYENDAYAQELYKQNQPYFDEFNLGQIASLAKSVAASGPEQTYSMLFEGETGTGKSTAARVLFYKIGLPWMSINCSTNIDEADIFGSMIPNPEKKSADDPEFIWQDGPATRAIRNGYGLIVEEGNGARPGVLLKFNSLLDDARQIELSNGEVVKAHPNFRLAFTANIAYQGTNELNRAFVDRFDIVHKFKDLDKNEVIDVVKKRTGYQDESKIAKVYAVYADVKKYSDENTLGLAFSIRRLLAIFTKGKFYKTAREAVIDMLLDHAFLQEPEHLKFFEDTILANHDLKFKI